MFENTKVNKRNWIIAFSIIIFISLINIFSKTIFQYDEAFTFSLANWFEPPYTGWVAYDSNQWISKDLLNNAYVINGGNFNLHSLINNQTFDVHPPLYYIFIRCLGFIFKGRFSIYIYLIFNLILLLINCIVVFNLLKIITKNEKFSLIGMVVFGTCIFVQDNLIFIRMYQLASTFVLLYVYFAILIIEKGNFRYYCFLFLDIILGGLTHYYFYVITLIFSFLLMIYLIYKKKFKTIVISIVIYAIAVLLNLFVLFPGTLIHFTFGHGEYALNSIGKIDINKILLYINLDISRLILFIVVLLLIIACIIKNKTNNIISLILLLSYVLYLLVVSQITDLLTSRFLYPADPIAIIGLLLIMYSFFDNKKSYLYVLICIVLVTSLYTVITNKVFNEKSWSFAKKHQDDVAIVFCNKNKNSNEYNDVQSALFADLRWYIATYVADEYRMDGYMQGERDFVLYVDKTVDTDSFLKEASKCFYDPDKYEISKLSIDTSIYNVYYAEIK